MAEDKSELKNIIEAALLAASEPLPIERMLSMFPQGSRPSRESIGAALEALARDYENRGIELKRIERGYRIQTREKYSLWISELQQERPPRYSRALLETLAIIAYKQPVTRGDIEAIRGVSVSPDIIRTLLEREWVRQVGYRDTPGKPALFGTTRKFVEHFNLGSLDELPPLGEVRDLAEIGKELNLPLEVVHSPEQSEASDSSSAAREERGPTPAASPEEQDTEQDYRDYQEREQA
ncbi:MAG: SMC-Scp complex subunit ScpB [Acidiferrobacterales bacterium]